MPDIPPPACSAGGAPPALPPRDLAFMASFTQLAMSTSILRNFTSHGCASSLPYVGRSTASLFRLNQTDWQLVIV